MLYRFVRHFSKENGKEPKEFTPDAVNALLEYDWPGNVRELRAAVEHGVVMASGPKIGIRDLPRSLKSPSSLSVVKPSTTTPREEASEAAGPLNLHPHENQMIEQALAETGGNITRASGKLGISRRTLHRKLKVLRGHDGEVNGEPGSE